MIAGKLNEAMEGGVLETQKARLTHRYCPTVPRGTVLKNPLLYLLDECYFSLMSFGLTRGQVLLPSCLPLPLECLPHHCILKERLTAGLRMNCALNVTNLIQIRF